MSGIDITEFLEDNEPGRCKSLSEFRDYLYELYEQKGLELPNRSDWKEIFKQLEEVTRETTERQDRASRTSRYDHTYQRPNQYKYYQWNSSGTDEVPHRWEQVWECQFVPDPRPHFDTVAPTTFTNERSTSREFAYDTYMCDSTIMDEHTDIITKPVIMDLVSKVWDQQKSACSLPTTILDTLSVKEVT